MTEEGQASLPEYAPVQGTHLRALRRAFRIHNSFLTPVAGFITAIPVAAVFIIGIAAGTDTGAIAMAVGANLIAIASLVGAPRLSLRVALVDSLFLGLSVFVGTLSSSIGWLHLLLLVPWCFGAGMLGVFGATSATVASQAVIAYVVLGRFTGSTLFAVHSSLLVALGALIEIVALLLLRLPSSLRHQRGRLAFSIEAVALLALQDPQSSATSALASLDSTWKVLDAPALFGRTDVRELRAIYDQVRRVRLEITTLSGLRVRLITLDDSVNEQRVSDSLVSLSSSLVELADALRRRSQASWRPSVKAFETRIDTLDTEPFASTGAQILATQCAEHLCAIAGQLRAMGKLVEDSDRASGKRVWRANLPEFVIPDFTRLRSDALTLKDNLNINSPACRHAIRLAVAVPAAALLGSVLGLPRSFWLTFAVLVVLKPDYTSLLDKGYSRIIGTIIGATVAALFIGGLHPDNTVTVLLVIICAWVAYSTWYASFAISFGFITALVLILMSITTNDTLLTALDRLVDFSLGSVIAIVAYLVWPTSLQTSVVDSMSSLYEVLERYLVVVIDVVGNKDVKSETVVARSRAVRVAWIRAESAVGRAVSEPGVDRSEVHDERGQLAATMRILRALHAIRFETERGATVAVSNELDEMMKGCSRALQSLSQRDDFTVDESSVTLRTLYRRAVKSTGETPEAEVLLIHLDELVNAIDTATALVRAQRLRPNDE